MIVKPVARKTFTPTGKLVSVHVFLEEVTDGGLVLPDGSSVSDTPESQVIGVGPDVTKCRIGDRVLVDPHMCVRGVVHRGQKVYVFHEDNVLGVVDR